MNQPFKRNYLQHALAVSEWMTRRGARGGIDARTQILEIVCGGKTVRFYPQFLIEQADRSFTFVAQLTMNVSGLVSWLPQPGKGWPSAVDKLHFKALAAATGMRTPKWTQDPAQARGAVLVKARNSSFCSGQRGPFEVNPESAAGLELAEGEYIEQFIVGRLVKAWFWNDELAAAEVVDMPTVRGDGRSTLRQLIAARLVGGDTWPTRLDELAAIQGLTLASVPAEGALALADYRYVSPLNPAGVTDHNVRSALRGTPLEAALLSAGAHVWAQVPEGMRQNTAFSLDGIVDRNGELWLLEANCNPVLHPAFYSVMLDRLFDVQA